MKLHRNSIATVSAMLLMSLTFTTGAWAAETSTSSSGDTSTPTSSTSSTTSSTSTSTTETSTPPVTTTTSTPPPVTTTTSTPPPTTTAETTPPVVEVPEVPVSPDVKVPKIADVPQAPAINTARVVSGAGELPFTGPGDVLLAVVIALLAGMGGTLLLMGAASREEIDGLNKRTLASASGFRVAYRELLKRQVGE